MPKKKPLNIIFLGRSGSGKGTQAKLLMKHFGKHYFYYVSTGDLFRDLAKKETDTGKRIKGILEKGGLPFDDLATTLWMYKIAYNVKENQGIIFDGAPRRVSEAKNIDEFLEFLGREKNVFVLLVDISRKEAFDRLTKRRICKKCGRLIPWVGKFKELKVCDKCGGKLIHRSDDKPEAIEGRMTYYEESVVPMIEDYEKQERLIRINGEQSIKDVFKDVKKALEE